MLCLMGLLFVQSAQAHLMVAQRGTLNFVGTGGFVVMSLPVDAFTGIDDDASLAEMLTIVLRQEGFDSRICARGDLALAEFNCRKCLSVLEAQFLGQVVLRNFALLTQCVQTGANDRGVHVVPLQSV